LEALLKQGWEADYDDWRKRDLSKRRFVYIWADGVCCNIRMGDRLCLLVIIGSDDTGRKQNKVAVLAFQVAVLAFLLFLTRGANKIKWLSLLLLLLLLLFCFSLAFHLLFMKNL